jgi:hypothetical protein
MRFSVYDHTPLLGTRKPGLIGDDGIPVSEGFVCLRAPGSEPAMFSSEVLRN